MALAVMIRLRYRIGIVRVKVGVVRLDRVAKRLLYGLLVIVGERQADCKATSSTYARLPEAKTKLS
jgi:hypothetical protein